MHARIQSPRVWKTIQDLNLQKLASLAAGRCLGHLLTAILLLELELQLSAGRGAGSASVSGGGVRLPERSEQGSSRTAQV